MGQICGPFFGPQFIFGPRALPMEFSPIPWNFGDRLQKCVGSYQRKKKKDGSIHAPSNSNDFTFDTEEVFALLCLRICRLCGVMTPVCGVWPCAVVLSGILQSQISLFIDAWQANYLLSLVRLLPCSTGSYSLTGCRWGGTLYVYVCVCMWWHWWIPVLPSAPPLGQTLEYRHHHAAMIARRFDDVSYGTCFTLTLLVIFIAEPVRQRWLTRWRVRPYVGHPNAFEYAGWLTKSLYSI